MTRQPMREPLVWTISETQADSRVYTMKTKIKMLRTEITKCRKETQTSWLTMICDITKICSSTRERVCEVQVSLLGQDVPIQQPCEQHRTFTRRVTSSSRSKPPAPKQLKLSVLCGAIQKQPTLLNLDSSTLKLMALWASMEATQSLLDMNSRRRVSLRKRKRTSLMVRQEEWETSPLFSVTMVQDQTTSTFRQSTSTSTS